MKGFAITREREFQDRTSISRLHETQDIGAYVNGIQVEAFQDYASGALNSVIAPISRSGADVTVIWRAKADAAAADNPQFTCTMWVSSYTPEKGDFGEEAMADFTLEPRGDVTRATS